MKEVPANKKKSLGKLPTPVRNKMGYMEEGGEVKKKPKINISREEFENQTPKEREAYNFLVKEMDRKIKEAGEKARKRNFKKGGSVKGKCRMDGIAVRGRTRAKERSK